MTNVPRMKGHEGLRSRARPSTPPRVRIALAALVADYAVLFLLAGAPSSPLRPPLPKGVTVPSWSSRGAALISLDRLGPAASTLLAVGLIAAAAAMFVVVLAAAWRGRVGPGPVLAAAAASLLLAVLAPLVLSRDVYSYAAYGRLFAVHGSNPYVHLPSSLIGDPFTAVLSPQWLRTRSLYGPAFTLLSGAIARLWPHSALATITAFKAVAGLATLGAAAAAAAACRLVRPERAGAAAAAGLNPVVVVHLVGGGHNDALVGLLFAAALLVALRGSAAPGWSRGSGPDPTTIVRSRLPWRSLGVTGLLTLAVMVKVPAAAALVGWVMLEVRAKPRQARARDAVLHSTAALAIAAAVSAPFYAGAKTVRTFATLTSVQGWASGPRLVARGAEALGRAMTGGTGTGFGRAIYAIFLAAFAIAFLRMLTGPRGVSPGHAWGVSMVVLALAAPYLLPWYSAWFLPMVPFLLDRRMAVIAIAASLLLALTGVPAEPAFAPGPWHDMVLAVHYAVAPLMLVLLLVALAITVRQPPGSSETGATVTSRLAKARA